MQRSATAALATQWVTQFRDVTDCEEVLREPSRGTVLTKFREFLRVVLTVCRCSSLAVSGSASWI